MNVNELPIRFPLEPDTKDYFFSMLTTMKDVMSKIVEQQLNMEFPERSISDICQTFFYVGIGIDKALDSKFKPGIDLVNESFSSQLKIFQNDLTIIAQNSLNRGVPIDFILEYLCFYYEDAHKKIFPNHPLTMK